MSAAILWFRRDLRVSDNPALQALLQDGYLPVPVFIHDEPDPDWPLGSASAWWLHHSLVALKKSLQKLGSDLLILGGDSQQQLSQLIRQTGAEAVYWNRCYEPAFVKRDEALRKQLKSQGISVCSYSANLLREPWQNLKKDDTPYRVFTPFWKSLHKTGPSRDVVTTPDRCPALEGKLPKSPPIESLGLLPAIHWDKAFYTHWQPGEDGAWKILNSFCETRLKNYRTDRDIPELSATSRLSAHLHFGEISPLQLWHYFLHWATTDTSPGTLTAVEAWLRQLGWREFSYHLLYHFPHTSLQPLDTRFECFPWHTDYAESLASWQKGRTGIPIVDAGMRELWATGYMHNRVRMIVASFLTKNLRIPWQEGARWFWDTLVDADLANNTMGWQWTAGSGADAAPFFRIFNPVLQGEKFDKAGLYVRRWVPELANLGNKFIHQPWAADPNTRADAGICLGEEYPEPVVDLKTSRQQALAAWDYVKQQSA
ncbi:MAG: DNA photolyase family protein [Proteobacteria bacterium]|nr:DNA photolyase family protein [Pseudomonadota bacterium]